MTSSIRRRIVCMFGATALLGAGTAGAIPTELTAAQFLAQIAGLATIVEDFEGFPVGNQSSPLAIANGTATLPGVAFVGPDICTTLNNCLWDNADILGARSFAGLPAGAAFWGTDFLPLGPSNPFRVTVVGGSGTLTVEAAGRDFWGFHDALGISSVSFLNLGTGGSFGNYSFDNVTTAAAAAVPEPSTWALLAVGGIFFGLRRAHSSFKPSLRPSKRGKGRPEGPSSI